MKNIHVFGISTPVGQSFKKIICKHYKKNNIFFYSRIGHPYIKFDLQMPKKNIIKNIKSKSTIISFAPIWHISFFLKYLISTNKKILNNIDSVIVLSSTSVLTKKFSTNKFDKDLYNSLKFSEDYLIDLSNKFNFNLSIIRPTLIYGSINNYSDKNVTKIAKIMKILPIIFIPKETGLRQPIHINQLAQVVFQIFENFRNSRNKKIVEIIEVGGDISLSYFEMLCSIRHNLLKTKRANIFKIIRIPNKLFYLLTFPIYFISPKIFESFLRIQADLSGFTRCGSIINKKKLKFPIEDI